MSEFDNNGYESTQTYGSYSEVENPSKAFGITSLVLGIISIPLICLSLFGLVVPVAGLVFGILSIVRKENAKGLAIAGIVCSSIAIVVVVGLQIYAYTHQSEILQILESLR